VAKNQDLPPRGSVFLFGRDAKVVAERTAALRDTCIRLFCGSSALAPWEPERPFSTLELPDKNLRSRVVTLQNVHLLAHSSDKPDEFYRNLLGRCNFYMLKGNAPPAAAATHFLLSGAALPAVFKNENLLRGYWEFVNCDTDGSDERAEELADDQDRAANALLSTNAYYLAPDAKIITPQEFEDFAKALRDSIIGQPEAVQRFVDSARLAVFAKREPDDKRPRAIFLLVGPSGVGKTEICRHLSKSLPGYAFTQINMAEHTTETAVDKLIGLGRGYQDSEMGGVLTEPIRRHPRQVVLFDEVDHSHHSVIQLFYKIFEGEVTDGRGRPVSFRDCYIVLTTNKGVVESPGGLGCSRESIEAELAKVKRPGSGVELFPPPLLGRLQSIIQFRTLDAWDLTQIARTWVERQLKRVLNQDGTTLEFLVPPNAIIAPRWFPAEHLLYEIVALRALDDPKQGARRLIRLLEDTLIQPILNACLKYRQREKASPARVTVGLEPHLPDLDNLDYEHPTFLLVDDDVEEEERLRAILAGLPGARVVRKGFDLSAIEQAFREEPIAGVLLDLTAEGEPDAGLAVLPRLRQLCGAAASRWWKVRPPPAELLEARGLRVRFEARCAGEGERPSSVLGATWFHRKEGGRGGTASAYRTRAPR
jgi:MoxR-like ATPase